MSPKPLPPGVHVILGDCAAEVFRRVFDPGDRLVIDRDVLNCGPTPRCETLEAWREARGEFWSSIPPYGALEFDSAGRELLDERERLREAERITLWAATGVSEQFFVAHVLHRAEQWGIDAGKIYLVQFERFHDRAQRVFGTGELNERRMSEYPEPAPIPAASLRDYRSAWSALTSPDPTDIERFGDRHPDANAWLRQAMQILLRRFPDKKSGLSWWDFVLLSEVRARGPIAARVIGFTMSHDWEDPDRMGDLYLFGRLLNLGDPRLPAPLVEMTGDSTKMREVQVTLTPFGLDVLEGKRSNYPTNPIEDRIAGVMLSSANGALWFNDAGHLLASDE
jgi:hypothetical protein